MANTYLATDNIDDLGRMLLALLSEVWVMRDRMAVMEELLASKVGLTTDDIDNYVPTPEFAAKLEALRQRVVTGVVGAPLAAEDRSVESILRRAGMSASPALDSANS